MAGSSPDAPEVYPVTRTLALLTLCLLAGPAPAADPVPLTSKQLADGWVKLFDGKTAFGWPKGATVEGGKLVLTAPADKELVVPLAMGDRGQFLVNYSLKPAEDVAANWPSIRVMRASDKGLSSSVESMFMRGGEGETLDRSYHIGFDRPQMAFTATLRIPAGGKLSVNQFLFRPLDAKPIFDGKTLDGWKAYAGDPKRERSKFEVTKDGELRVTDGPGDLQTTAKYADFLLQFDCKTRGKNLNSGVFFRCLPGEYQAGYEVQIQNAYKDDDRTKPTDFGTGAIYRRVAARKVVSNDNEWFTMTVLAVGPTIRTWVNGEPVVSWTDDRPRDDNARKGLRTAAGHLSIQGHDPTTDIVFRNLRVLDIK